MKGSFQHDRTRQEMLHAEVDLKDARFSMPQGMWRRITLNALIFVPLMVLARYFENTFMFWFALAWGGMATAWQILAYGVFGMGRSDPRTDVVRTYGKGTLIFLAVFWAVLITAVSVALYLKAP